MSNTDRNLNIKRVGPEGHHHHYPVDGGSHIYRGVFLAPLTATGMMVPGTTALSGHAVAIATHEQDATGLADAAKHVRGEFDRDFVVGNDDTNPFTEADLPGAIAWMVDDHTVSNSSNGGTRKAGGIFQGMEVEGPRVQVTPKIATMIAESAAADGPVYELELTIGEADLTAGATSQVFNLGGVLPADAIVVGREVSLATNFTGGGTTDAKLEIGIAGDHDSIMTSLDIDAGAPFAVQGTAGVNPNGNYGGQQLVVTVTSTGANVTAFTAGSVTVRVSYYIAP